MAALRPPAFASFSLLDDPAGLWIAEEGGRPVGFSFAWTCEELWFLAQLFVSPGARALNVSRLKHHRYLLQGREVEGIWLHAEGSDERVGYAYLGDGHIGPMAVSDSACAAPALRTMLKLAVASGAPQVSAFVSSRCEEALAAALDSGMRIGVPMVLMSNRVFGDWGCYLPRNPGFM